MIPDAAGRPGAPYRPLHLAKKTATAAGQGNRIDMTKNLVDRL
jgi:hypothetical protein